MSRTRRTSACILVVVAALFGAAGVAARAATGTTGPSMAAVPDATCGPGSLPETEQGRAPAADFTSGRAAQGYRCNTSEVSHFGQTAGLKVFRFVDQAGHVCAFYDSTQF